MSVLQLIVKNLLYYRRSHAGTFLGIIVASAVLTGALLVGDSVRYSLDRFAQQRLGGTELAIDTGNRFFSDRLAQRLSERTGVRAAPVLQLPGSIMSGFPDGSGRQLNNVRILGIDERFWDLGPEEGRPDGTAVRHLEHGEVVLSERVASRLKVWPGSDVTLRIGLPSLLSRDALLSSGGGDKATRLVLLRVREVVSGNGFGRFSLRTEQTAPENIMVDLSWLQQITSMEGRVNILLAGDGRGFSTTPEELQRNLKEVMGLEDTGFRLLEIPGAPLVYFSSERIFFSPPVSEILLDLDGSAGSLTYIVNLIVNRRSGKEVPYSFVSAVSPVDNPLLSPVPADLEDNQIIINRWLADQLQAGPGDSLTLDYYRLSPVNRLVEQSRSFKVRQVLEMEDVQAERNLVPAFPGLTDVDDCREWDIGMPMDEGKLSDEANQEYWEQYRTTPKAFVTLKTGQQMWGNRFGDLTGVRFISRKGAPGNRSSEISAVLDPAHLGLVFIPVRQLAERAVDSAVDFGGLFLGLSIFLIVSALMLTGLLFVFSLEKRAPEMGTLLAIGFPARKVHALYLAEGLTVAIAGAAAGGFFGTLYTRVLIGGLGNIWKGAVAQSAIVYHGEPVTILTGSVLTAGCGFLVMVIQVRYLGRNPVRRLLSGMLSDDTTGSSSGKRGTAVLIISAVCFVIAGAVSFQGAMSWSENPAPSFFLAGTLILIAGLALTWWFMDRLDHSHGGRVSVTGLGIRNTARRKVRSLTVVGLMACACFMVFSVSAMRTDSGAVGAGRKSGTGGFGLFVQSTIPLPGNPGSRAGRTRLGLGEQEPIRDEMVVPVKVGQGDDASCFNLNRAQTPRLLGIDPDLMSQKRAFLPDGFEDIWQSLKNLTQDGFIPALAGDSDTALWNLGLTADREKGDLLDYRDEQGREFQIRLVGTLPVRKSIFQGSIIISLSHFTDLYPSRDGWGSFLVDTAPGEMKKIGQYLERRLSRYGVEALPASERLREFYTVENTYLAIFLVLGGLGLALGTVGLGVLLFRNAFERRSELALLTAVGYDTRSLMAVLFAEHFILFAFGIVWGTGAAALAVLPALAAPGSALPWGTLVSVFILILFTGTISAAFSARAALRGNLLAALNKE